MLKRKLIASLLVTAMTFSLFVPNIALALDSVETDETMPPDETAYTEVTETEPVVEETIGTETSEEVIETTTETTPETSEPTETSDETEVTETTETSEITEETTEETEVNLVAFDQTVIVDDTRIQVIADEGVFPEGAYLEATKIENVNIDRSSNVNLVDTMSFDICIYDENGVEIEPDTSAGSVSVLFFDERIADTNLDTTIYHIEDNNPTALEYSYIDGNGDITDSENVAVAVEAETEGFSVYTVEFTYNDMSYVLNGSESVSLSTILEAVGLVGTVENVVISDTSLINFDGVNLTAVKPFNSAENMIVTINGIDYEISITDENDIATCGEDAYAIIYDNGTMVIQKGANADDSIGTATHILSIGATGTPWLDSDNNIDYTTEITNVIFKNELIGRTSLSGFFATCGNITSITGLNLLDTSEVTDVSGMFYNCASLETIDVSGFDTANITNMSSLFSGCSSLSSLNVSNFNTSNVTNMGAMFYGCSSLTTLDLSTFNVSKVTMMGGMFSTCTNLNTLILDNWDFGNNYSIGGMLGGINVANFSAKNWKNFPASFTNIFGRSMGGAATNINVTGWDLTGVTSISGLFCSNAIENIVGINTWIHTDDLTDISQMFNGASITSIDLSEFDTSNITNFSSMFSGCTKLESIDISNFVINCDISGTGGMFSGTTSLQTIILPNSISNAINNGSNSLSLNGMWLKEGEETPIWGENIISGGTYHISNEAGKAYAGIDAYAILYSDGTLVFQKGNTPDTAHGDVVQTWFLYNGTHSWTSDTYSTQVTNVVFRDELVGYTSAYAMFEKCSNLTSISLENFDVSRISNTGFMFNGCTSLVEVTNASDLVNSNNTSTRCMFQNCANLISIEGTESWSLGNTTNPSYMFYGCELLTGLETINWGMNQATTVKCMFYNCSSLTKLDISYWNVSALSGASEESCGWVFYGCSGLTSLDLSNWNVASGNTFFKSMFCNCTSLEEVDISGIDMSAADDISYMFYNCPALNKVVLPNSFNRNNATTTNNFGLTGWWTDGTNQMEGKDIVSGGTYTRADVVATVDVDAYQIIYNNNGQYICVVQKGNTPDPSMGTVVSTGFLKNYTVGLGSQSYDISKIIIRDRLVGMKTIDFLTSSNTTSFDVIGLEKIDTSSATQIGLHPAMNSIDGVQNWDLSNVTSLSQLFMGTSYSTTGTDGHSINFDLTPLASWDVSNVTNMYGMFLNVWDDDLDLSPIANWNVSNVTNMNSMFAYANFDPSELANWNTENLTNLHSAFHHANLPSYEFLKNWDVSNVTDFSWAFRASTFSDTSILSDWNTGSATNIQYIFADCPNLANTNGISDWDVSNVTDFSYAFANDIVLYNATLNWDFGASTGNSSYGGMYNMFNGCTALKAFNSNKTWTARANYNNISNMFSGCSSLYDISGLAGWDVSNVINMNSFLSNTAITDVDSMSSWNTPINTQMFNVFGGCTSLADISGLEDWDVSSVEMMNNLFENCTSLSDISALSDWNTGNVVYLRGAFKNCGLESLDALTNWNTSKVTTLYETFCNNISLTDLDGLDNWDVSKVTTMYALFYGDTVLSDMTAISNWNTASLTNYGSLFYNCRNLHTADFSGWDLSHMTNSQSSTAVLANTALDKLILPASFTINTNDVSRYGYNYSLPDAIGGEWTHLEDNEVCTLSTVLSNFTAEDAGTYYKRFNLTLYPMGGTVVGSRVFTYSLIESIDELPTPTWENHTFLGWYDLNGNRRTSVGPNESITKLFARWETSSYNLVLYPNKPSLNPITINLGYDEVYKLSNVFGEIPNEELIGWSTRSNGAGTVYNVDEYVSKLTSEPDGTYVLYAQWNSTLNDTIPVHAHLINFLTGEEVSNTLVQINIPEGNIYSQLTSAVTLPNSADRMHIWAFADDLDAVHFDNTGLQYNGEEKWSDYVYEDDHVTQAPGNYYYINDYILDERAHYVQSHEWSLADFNTDVYGYFIPSVTANVWFEPQIIEDLDDFTMTLDGQEYRTGEYKVHFMPDNWNSDIGTTQRYISSNNYQYGAQVAQHFLEERISVEAWALISSDNSPLRRATFSDGLQYSSSYYGMGRAVELFYQNSNGNWTSSTNNKYRWYGLTLDDEIDVTCSLLSGVYYDFNGGTNRDGTKTGEYYTYYCGSGYSPNIREVGRLYGSICYRDGYSFDGYWTEPEGGIQIIKPNNLARDNEEPVDMTTFNVTNVPASANAGSVTKAPTLYAHWTTETSVTSNHITVIRHDERSYTPVNSYTTYANFAMPVTLRTEGDNKTNEYQSMFPDPEEYEYDGVHMFAGWYTEPNGQGEKIEHGFVIEDYTIEVYAYWPESEVNIYYDAYSYGDSPTNVIVEPGYDRYADYFTSGTPAYFTVDSSTPFSYELIPIARTNEGYKFLGWFDAEGNPIEYGNTPVGTEDVTYYAHWEKYVNTGDINYSLTYEYLDHTNMAVITNRSATYLPTIHFAFSINSTTNTIPTGAIRIDLNYYMWQQFPTTADVSHGKYFVRRSENVNGRTVYYVTNGVDIAGAAGFDMTFSKVYPSVGYDCTNTTSNPYPESTTEVMKYYPISVKIDIDPNDNITEVTDGANLYAKFMPVTLYSRLGQVYLNGTQITSWDDNWGIRPADWDDYVYVRWDIYTPNGATTNQRMYGYMRAIMGNIEGEVINGDNLLVGDEYWDDYDSNASTRIVMRYPKSQFDYQADRAVITQSVEYLRIPQYNYYNGDKFNRLDTLNATVTVNWAESAPWQGNGDDVYFNLGRWTYNSSNYRWGYDTYQGDRALRLQRQYLENDWPNAGHSVQNEMSWFGLWARRKYNNEEYSSLAIQPGDVYYNSGAAEDFYMFNTSTGRYQLNEDEYYISNVSWHIYNGYAQEIVDEMGQATGSNELTDMLRADPVEIWVQYRGSDEWVLYNTNMGNTIYSSNPVHWKDSHIDVNFQREYNLEFHGITNIVGVMVRAAYGDSNYQVLQLEPRIQLVSTGPLYPLIETDFNQEVFSTFIMDFREGIDPTTQGSNGTSYTSGDWGANLTWDGDCALITWDLTSDVSNITLQNGTSDYSNGRLEDNSVTVYAQNVAETTTYYKPIDSGIFYILLPENSTYSRVTMATFATAKASSTACYTTDWSYSNATATQYSTSVPRELYSVESIENWENSGRTMLVVTFNNLSSLENYNKRNRVEVYVDLYRSILDKEMYGYWGEVCSLFVNTSAVHPNYVGYYNTFSNYQSSAPQGSIVKYFANLNTQYTGGDIAYSRSEVHFDEPPTPDPTLYQNGFNEFIANSSLVYNSTTTVYPGEEFSYRLIYSQDESAWIKGPIFYAELDGIGAWQRANMPTLTGMIEGDVEVQVTPTVYYCMDPNFDLDNVDSIDLNDGTWTTTEPVGQVVYGLVIDYSKDNDGNTVTYVSTHLADITIFEKNTCTVNGQQFTGEAILRSENNQEFGASVSGGVLGVTVELPDLSINIEANPESGTQAEPRNVQYEQDLIYSITASNNGARAVNNVVVTAAIPEGTTLESLTHGGLPLTDSTKFSNIVITDSTITFTINTLRAGESVTVMENTYVSTTENYKVLTNTGHITSYNDMVLDPELQFNSNTTYHITFTVPDPTGLSIAGLTEMIMATLVICGTLFFIKKKRKAIN